MFTGRRGYTFLERMRRPEGIAPKVEQDVRVRLGTTPRKLYEISLSITLLIIIVGFKFFPFEIEKRKVIIATRENVTIEDIEQTRQENRPPPPPKPPVPIEAPGAEALEDVPLPSSELDVTQDVAPPPPPKVTEAETEDEYFMVVEELPELIGGYEGLMRRLVYPQVALRAGIQGRVQLIAYVNERGDVDKVEVISGLAGGCTEAAVEAVKQSKFIPGKQRGRPVKVKVAMSIRFHIAGSSS
ncbi:MAG TPA: energy transducer TonB [Bacteroidota bacterium]|nr:energy transducer TonB [Bacteroidota bacterium]